MFDCLKDKGKVYSQSAGEVGEGKSGGEGVGVGGCGVRLREQSCYELSLVSGGLFAGALLHGKMWRVENIVECSPRRNFGSCYLSAPNLVESKGHVDVGVRWCVGARVRECELAHIVVGMLPDKLKGGGVVIHYSLFTYYLKLPFAVCRNCRKAATSSL